MDVKQKQQYLVEEIINKGFDANSFAIFIQEQREDGDDLSNWSFGSLKGAVEKFKGNIEVLKGLKEDPQAPAERDVEERRLLAAPEAPEENGQMYRSHIENLEAEITRVEEGIREGNRSRSDSLQEKMNRALTQAKEDANKLSIYEETVATSTAPNSVLAQTPNIKVTISCPRTVNKGMFSKKYTVYKVSTFPLYFEVERRFSDFWWLRSILQRDYPGFYIPPMANKSGTTSKLDPEVISIRLDIMQHFLDSVVEHPTLLSCPAFAEFLLCKEDDFKKFKKEFDKTTNPNAVIATSGINKKLFYIKNPIKVDHLITSPGKVECKMNSQLSTFGKAFKILVKDVVPHQEKFLSLSKQLTAAVGQARLIVNKMGESVTQMHTVTKKFGDMMVSDGLQRWDSVEKIYSTLESTLKNYADSMDQQVQSFSKTVVKSFEYSRREISALEEMIKLKEDASTLFFKSFFELEAKKDKAIKQGEWSKFAQEIEASGIPKEELKENHLIAKQVIMKDETTKLDLMRSFFGFLNNQMHCEATWYFGWTAKRFNKAMEELAQLQVALLSEEMRTYNGIVFRDHPSGYPPADFSANFVHPQPVAANC